MSDRNPNHPAALATLLTLCLFATLTGLRVLAWLIRGGR